MRGPILEVGLGNGRTYDHLRELFPARDIYVFERKVAAHPDCVPPDDRLFLGDADKTIVEAAQKLGPTAALIHTDLGTGDHDANVEMGKWLGPALDRLAVSGGYVLANQALDVARWQRLPEPPGRAEGPVLPLSRGLAADQPQQHQQHDRTEDRPEEAGRFADLIEAERLAAHRSR